MKRAIALSLSHCIVMLLGVYQLPPAQGQDPDYILELSETTGYTDDTGDAVVTLFSSGSSVSGFQFAVCNDSLIDADIGDVTPGPDIDQHALDSISIVYGSDSWSMAVVSSSGTMLSDGETYAIAIATYDLLTAGDSELTFCDSVKEPLVTIEGGSEVEPTTVPGVIAVSPAPLYLRGDVNANGRVEPLLDAKYLLTWLFEAGDEPPCLEAADVDDNGEIPAYIWEDASVLFRFGFEGGDELAFPGTETCGGEPAGGELGCALADPCPSDPPALVTDSSVLLSFGDALDSVEVGEEFDVPVLVTVMDGAIQGIQFGVCDGEGIAVADLLPPAVAITPGADSESFLFIAFQQQAGGWSAGMLPSDLGTSEIGPGEHELAVGTYVIEGAGVWSIEFCDGLGDPPIDVRAIRDLEYILPELGPPKVIEGSYEVVEGLLFTDHVAYVGESVDVSVLISHLYDHLEGWHWGVCHDDLVSIESGDIADGEALAGLDFSTHVLNFEAGGWTTAALLDLTTGGTLSPGFRQEAYVATCHLGDSSGTSTLRFCDSLGDPPVSVGWLVDGSTVEPPVYEGSITIRPAFQFTYGVSVPSLTYSPDSVPAEMTFTVDLTIHEDINYPGYPNETMAIEMRIAHDDTKLELVSAELSDIVNASNGGEGPLLSVFNLDPEDGEVGLRAIVIFSVAGGGENLSFDTTTPIVHVHYALTGDALASLEGNVDGLESTLDWNETLGPPSFNPNRVTLPGPPSGFPLEFTIFPGLENGTVRIQPDGSLHSFLRGDCNGNGQVSALSDGLFLLRYNFSGGDAPPCLDAADVDDSGSVSGLTDTLYLLRWGFSGGAAPPAPGASKCGVDATNDVTNCDTDSGGCD